MLLETDNEFFRALHHPLSQLQDLQDSVRLLHELRKHLRLPEPTSERIVLSDLPLIAAVYLSLVDNIQNVTHMGLMFGRLQRFVIHLTSGDQAIRRAMLDHVVTELGPYPAHSRTNFSVLIAFSILAGDYEYLNKFVDRRLDELERLGRIDCTMALASRSLAISASTITNVARNDALPLDLRKYFNGGQAHRVRWHVQKRLDNIISANAAKLGPCFKSESGRPFTRVLFILDDFVFYELDTLTKLMCDILWLLASHSDAEICVRVCRMTYGYVGAGMPCLWDPPSGEFETFIKGYYGPDSSHISKRIDFEFVNLWSHSDDYISSVVNVILETRPDVCITCLNVISMMEQIAYLVCPLLQIEVINGSRFVRYADGVIPNGAIDQSRAQEVTYLEAKLPQIPFTIKAELTKQDFGFSPDQYLMIVVGKEFATRMVGEGKSELAVQFSRTLSTLLAEYPQVALLLVGEAKDRAKAFMLEGGCCPDWSRVTIIEFAVDLRATMKACDLMVNPPINGGGRGPALAISDQVPVLIFSGTDAENFVPGDNICKNMNEFRAAVERYIALGSGYREDYSRFGGVVPFSDSYNRQSALDLLAAARLVASIGRNRLSSASQLLRNG